MINIILILMVLLLCTIIFMIIRYKSKIENFLLLKLLLMFFKNKFDKEMIKVYLNKKITDSEKELRISKLEKDKEKDLKIKFRKQKLNNLYEKY